MKHQEKQRLEAARRELTSALERANEHLQPLASKDRLVTRSQSGA